MSRIARLSIYSDRCPAHRVSADGGAVNIFPFTGEDMAVNGLRRHRWRKGIHGDISMNRRLGASCCEQCAGEKGISREDDQTMSGQEPSFDRSWVLHSPCFVMAAEIFCVIRSTALLKESACRYHSMK